MCNEKKEEEKEEVKAKEVEKEKEVIEVNKLSVKNNYELPKKKETEKKEKCFVIMPISDPEGYESGHFNKVYELIKEAIHKAGFEALRVDEQNTGNFQCDILEDILTSEMAICDLTTRNPNVLFELALRQAANLPVVLIQEEGTQFVSDITTLSVIPYKTKGVFCSKDIDTMTDVINKAIKRSYSQYKQNKKTNSMFNILSQELRERVMPRSNIYTKAEMAKEYEEFIEQAEEAYVLVRNLDFLKDDNSKGQIEHFKRLGSRCKIMCYSDDVIEKNNTDEDIESIEKKLKKDFVEKLGEKVELRFYSLKNNNKDILNVKGQFILPKYKKGHRCLIVESYGNVFRMIKPTNDYLGDILFNKAKEAFNNAKPNLKDLEKPSNNETPSFKEIEELLEDIKESLQKEIEAKSEIEEKLNEAINLLKKLENSFKDKEQSSANKQDDNQLSIKEINK